jgi:hypothetical protein
MTLALAPTVQRRLASGARNPCSRHGHCPSAARDGQRRRIQCVAWLESTMSWGPRSDTAAGRDGFVGVEARGTGLWR